MTVLDEPPVELLPESVDAVPERRSPINSWRFAARVARREVRLRPGRTVLAALLIAVPVAAMTLGSVLVRTGSDGWPAQFARRYGDADVVVDPWFGFAEGPGDAPELTLPPGTESASYVHVQTSVTPAGQRVNESHWVTFSDIDLRDPLVGDPYEVLAGRAPRAGEAAIGRDLADRWGLSVGDTLELARPSGSWPIVGIVRSRDSYYDTPLVIPGFDRDRLMEDWTSLVTLHRLPAGVEPDSLTVVRSGAALSASRSPYPIDDVTQPLAWGWVAGVLALVGVGIIVAAAFATSARRQLVTVGQLASNGATEGTVRRTLALQGTWTALVGVVVGVGLALGSLPFVRGLVAQTVQHDLAAYRIAAADLIMIALTALAAGTLAALVPARSAARIPVLAALGGRRPTGDAPRWLVPTGIGLFGGGIGLIGVGSLGAAGAGSSGDVWAFVVVLGGVGVLFGMCCSTPLVVARIGEIGGRMPLSWRLGLRSLTRARTRSAAVVAAIATAVGMAVAAAVLAEAAIAANIQQSVPTLPANVIVLEHYDNTCCGPIEPVPAGTIVDRDPLGDIGLDTALQERLQTIVPGASFEPLRFATFDPAPFDAAGDFNDGHGPLIADDIVDLLGLAEVDLATLQREGSLVPRGRWDFSLTYDSTWVVPPGGYRTELGSIQLDPPLAQRPYGYNFAAWHAPLLSAALADDLGFDIVTRGVVVRAPEELSVRQIDELGALAAELGGGDMDAFVEPGDPARPSPNEPGFASESWSVTYDDPRWRTYDDDMWIARAVIVGAALLLSLFVVAIGLALAASEGREERDTLLIVGARPSSMRRQAAARAAVVALVGITLGIPTGFVPAWVAFSAAASDDPTMGSAGVPWLVIGTLLAVIPALVAAMAWVAAGVTQRLRPARASGGLSRYR